MRRPITITMDDELRQTVDLRARSLGQSRSAYIEDVCQADCCTPLQVPDTPVLSHIEGMQRALRAIGDELRTLAALVGRRGK